MLSKHETITKNRNITINLLSTVYLDIITTINYNLQYIRYTTTFRNACHVDTPLLMSLEKVSGFDAVVKDNNGVAAGRTASCKYLISND